MLWVPVRRKGRVLIDGGMIDPVPESVLREMGTDTAIAVNVVPPLRKGADNVLTRAWRRLNALNPISYLGDRRYMPSLFDVMMNTVQIIQHELGSYKAITADVLIVPDLADFTWIEFYRPLELIERGARATEQALPEIERVLEERRAAAAA